MKRGIGWACVVTLALAAAASPTGQAPSRGGFRWERPVTPGGAGPGRLDVDATLVAGGAPFLVERIGGDANAAPRSIARDGLRDLRLADALGREVPYLLVDPPAPEPMWIDGRLFAVAAVESEQERTSGFELDVGRATRVDRLRVSGLPAPFLKRVRLEGSGDRARWTLLVAEGTLFDLPDEEVRQLELPFAPGEFRYLRLVWDDSRSGRLPLPAGAAARASRADSVTGPVIGAPLVVERRPSEPGHSRFRLRLPGPRLPIVALDLAVGGGYLRRAARVTESRLSGYEAVPVELGAATLVRAARGDLVAAHLRIPIEPPTEVVLDLMVDDGDNPPLGLTAVTATFAELPWIYFESADGGPLVARYGQPSLARPAYDLEALRASLATVTPHPARWGEPHALEPETSPPAASEVGEHVGAAIDLAPFRFEREIPSGPATLVAMPLDAAVLAHSAGALGGRFADLRIVDAGGRQVPYLLERLDEPFVVSLPPPARLADGPGPVTPGRAVSRYRLQLPYPRLPEGTVVLETSARTFERAVRVSIEHPPDARHRDPWTASVSGADWRHVDPDTPAPGLGLPIPTVDTTDLLVTVDEGDNSPLPIASASLLLPSVRVRFFRPSEVALRMVYGQEGLAPPRYDLALLAGTVLGSAATEITASAERSIEPPAPSAMLSPAIFWGALILAVVVLLGLVVRLMRAGTEGAA